MDFGNFLDKGSDIVFKICGWAVIVIVSAGTLFAIWLLLIGHIPATPFNLILVSLLLIATIAATLMLLRPEEKETSQ